MSRFDHLNQGIKEAMTITSGRDRLKLYQLSGFHHPNPDVSEQLCDRGSFFTIGEIPANVQHTVNLYTKQEDINQSLIYFPGMVPLYVQLITLQAPQFRKP